MSQLIINPTTGQDQQYSAEVQILDIKHNSISTNAGLQIDEPDAAAVDLNTGLAVVVDEDGAKQTLINLNKLVASYGPGECRPNSITSPDALETR